MTSDRIADLFKRLRENKCTDEEIAELNTWYHGLKGGRPDFEAWIKESGGEEQLTGHLFDRFNQKMAAKQRSRSRQVWYSVAAAVFIAIMAGIIFIPNQNPVLIAPRTAVKNVVAPGTNRAILTLADGSEVDLDNSAKGYLAKQAGGVNIRKAGNGKLIYENTTGAAIAASAYNTIATPRAGQYEIDLPDGTKVWLNAASSLKYPISFKANERRVELTGEAYFEVAHNKAAPFKVTTGGQTVTVLGTHFNIKGYTDDAAISTTLIEGSVLVSNQLSNKTKRLVPGKQSDVVRGDGDIALSNANVDQVMAWKNGYFIFDNQDIRSIMKLISRWYDVDVTYDLKRSDARFGGTFSRSSDLNQLLKNLELLGDIHFKIKERRITVSN
jgi:transmembrane sensor